MNIDQINALNRFALIHARGWKHKLHTCWLNASYPSTVPDADKALLQQLRNNGGAALLETFIPRKDGFKRVGYLLRDRMECFTLKQGWFENAWRIVTEAGQDMVQPWDKRKSEAKETANELGIFLVGMLP